MEAGYVIERPNRAKASSKSTRATVVLLLLVSVALMLIVIVGGWGSLQGGPIQVSYIVLYLLLAFYIGRWNRGALPVTAALAIILAIFAGVAGPEWLARDKDGFATPEMLFGGDGLESSVLGLITFLLIPIQVLLIAFCAQGFRQDWHVELEVPTSRAADAGPGGSGLPGGSGRPGGSGATPAGA